LWDDISYITRSQSDPRTYPTQKPLKLLQRIVELSTNKDDWILDPTAGSGTTGIAASLLGRKCRMIDINPDAKKIFDLRNSSTEGNELSDDSS
jgi:site-specific DNA-methyltransferase (adenine-specific)